MSRVIPKEQLTAYQRWELGSVDPRPEPPPPPQPEPIPEPEPVISVALPTAEDLERIQKEAWQEGHDLGFAEGRKEGYAAGYQEGDQEARLHVERLRELVEALETEALRQDDALAREVLELALNVAQQMLRASIEIKPQSILVVIREALLALPTLSGHHKVVVHPSSLPIVKEWLAKEHGHLSWKVIADELMPPGGFRFEGAQNELDAGMETRWREITACLGTDTSWMA